jgi:hypothetical protein
MNSDTKTLAETWFENIQVNLANELEAFNKLSPRLLTGLKGWYVAVSEGRLIDKDQNEFVLAERISRSHPDKFILIQPVET